MTPITLFQWAFPSGDGFYPPPSPHKGDCLMFILDNFSVSHVLQTKMKNVGYNLMEK